MALGAARRRLVPAIVGGGVLAVVALSAPAWLPSDPESEDAPAAPSGAEPAPTVASRAQLAKARHRLAARLAALEADLRPFPTEVPLRTLFRRAEIELEVAAAAEGRGAAPAAAWALARAAADLAAAEKQVAARTTRLRDPQVRRSWQRWADTAVAASRAGSAVAVVDKLGHRCLLLARGRVVASFAADLGRSPLADKLFAGDAATPEGIYHVVEKKEGSATHFHRALLLDYPTALDRQEFAAARRAGLVPHGRGIGGLIEIHGHGGRGSDWTNGCVALRNADMDVLYAALPVGAAVAIVGTARLPGADAPAGATMPEERR